MTCEWIGSPACVESFGFDDMDSWCRPCLVAAIDEAMLVYDGMRSLCDLGVSKDGKTAWLLAEHPEIGAWMMTLERSPENAT